jgi:hypothetical protein
MQLIDAGLFRLPEALAMQPMPKENTQVNSQPAPFVRWFADIRLGDVPLVGGKTASKPHTQLAKLG